MSEGLQIDFTHRLAHEKPNWQDDIEFYDCMTLPLGIAVDLLRAYLDADHELSDNVAWAALYGIQDAQEILRVWLDKQPAAKLRAVPNGD